MPLMFIKFERSLCNFEDRDASSLSNVTNDNVFKNQKDREKETLIFYSTDWCNEKNPFGLL